jgi:hypothetical protein
VVSISDEVIWFFSWPNPSSYTMALVSTKRLTELSTRNLPGGKGRPAHKTDNLIAICEPIVYKMWKPRRLTTLWASTVCYRGTFTFLYICLWYHVSKHSETYVSVHRIRHHSKIPKFYFLKYPMWTEVTIAKISLDTQEFSFLSWPTQQTSCPRKWNRILKYNIMNYSQTRSIYKHLHMKMSS